MRVRILGTPSMAQIPTIALQCFTAGMRALPTQLDQMGAPQRLFIAWENPLVW